MNTHRRLAAAVLLAAVVTLTPTAAQAVGSWPSDITNSSYRWEIDSGLDSYGSTDAADVFTSQFYDTGVLNFREGGTVETSGDWCSDPISAPGGVAMDGADTVITCAPYVIPGGQPGAGLTATVQIRIIDALNVARIFYSIENATGSDIDVPEVYLGVEWEYGTYNGLSSSGVRGDGSSSMSFGEQDTWIVTAESNTEMPSGIAWAAGCDSSFAVTGEDASYMEIGTGETTTFGAGTTTYYATFLQMQTPSAQTDDAMNVAIDALGASLASRFASLSPELAVGLPSGISIEFWKSACPTPEPTLPNTGSDGGAMVAVGASALMIIVTGLIAFVRRRTRS